MAKDHESHKKESASSSNKFQFKKKDDKKKTSFTKKKATVNETKDTQETDADTVIEESDNESSPKETKN